MLEIRARDFGPAQRSLEGQVETDLGPLRERYPDYRIVYFGSAPIGLAVQLGFLLETWQQIAVVPHHHARRTWGWLDDPGQTPARLAEVDLPDYRDRSIGVAVVRVSTSHTVDRLVTLSAVPDPLRSPSVRISPSYYSPSKTRPGRRSVRAPAFAFPKTGTS